MKNAIKVFATAAALFVAGVSQVTAQSNANDALLEAAKSGIVEDVQTAIKAGADVNAGNKYGDTALIYAAWYNEKS